jgi:hypothetical protein
VTIGYDPRRGFAIHYMRADTHFTTAGQHLMSQFVPDGLPDGAPCTEMGDHFPCVCRGGVPQLISPPQSPNANSPHFQGEVSPPRSSIPCTPGELYLNPLLHRWLTFPRVRDPQGVEW